MAAGHFFLVIVVIKSLDAKGYCRYYDLPAAKSIKPIVFLALFPTVRHSGFIGFESTPPHNNFLRPFNTCASEASLKSANLEPQFYCLYFEGGKYNARVLLE